MYANLLLVKAQFGFSRGLTAHSIVISLSLCLRNSEKSSTTWNTLAPYLAYSSQNSCYNGLSWLTTPNGPLTTYRSRSENRASTAVWQQMPVFTHVSSTRRRSLHHRCGLRGRPWPAASPPPCQGALCVAAPPPTRHHHKRRPPATPSLPLVPPGRLPVQVISQSACGLPAQYGTPGCRWAHRIDRPGWAKRTGRRRRRGRGRRKRCKVEPPPPGLSGSLPAALSRSVTA